MKTRIILVVIVALGILGFLLSRREEVAAPPKSVENSLPATTAGGKAATPPKVELPVAAVTPVAATSAAQPAVTLPAPTAARTLATPPPVAAKPVASTGAIYVAAIDSQIFKFAQAPDGITEYLRGRIPIVNKNFSTLPKEGFDLSNPVPYYMLNEALAVRDGGIVAATLKQYFFIIYVGGVPVESLRVVLNASGGISNTGAMGVGKEVTDVADGFATLLQMQQIREGAYEPRMLSVTSETPVIWLHSPTNPNADLFYPVKTEAASRASGIEAEKLYKYDEFNALVLALAKRAVDRINSRPPARGG